jgi:DNA-binding PadR family transcriptional regulator
MNAPALGELEQIVLLALLRLGDQAYGVAVAEEIADRAGRRISFGAVYTTLDRMESKGLVASRTGEATAERGGRAKRYFRPTALGQKALEASQTALARMKEGLALP